MNLTKDQRKLIVLLDGYRKPCHGFACSKSVSELISEYHRSTGSLLKRGLIERAAMQDQGKPRTGWRVTKLGKQHVERAADWLYADDPQWNWTPAMRSAREAGKWSRNKRSFGSL